MADQIPPIIYISNAGLDYGLPTNRQQLPKRLASHTKVLYSSPFSLSQALLGKISFRRFSLAVHELEPNLYLMRNLQLLPLVRAQIWPFHILDRWLTTRQIKQHAAALGFQRPILWFYYPPSYRHLIGQFDEVLTCYHCTDDHAGHAAAFGLDAQATAADEERLVAAVDVVFTTSRPLYERHRRHNPNTYLLPNVADVSAFLPVAAGQVTPAAELSSLRRPIAGFVGAVDAYKINLQLIEAIARLLPHWTFVLVGPVGSGDGTRLADLPHLPNVVYLGARPYAQLPHYLAGFDVCIIPYVLNAYTAGVFPLKFWEYMAAGKPVVTTPLPGISDYFNEVEVANTPAEFAAALERALPTAGDVTAVEHRIALASGQSWEARAAEIVQILSSHLSRDHSAQQTSIAGSISTSQPAAGNARVSVVVPTFNRAEMLCKVLPSYLASPAVVEVIVVDDAGHDHTAQRVADLAVDEPRLRYLRNDRNLGAPATRNRGAAAASGDWVLQGEDDLALGPGCIDTLLAHAHSSGADVIAGRRIWMRLGESEEAALARANLDRNPPFNEWLMDFNSHARTQKDIELPLLDATMLMRRGVVTQLQYHAPYGGQSTWREESDVQVSALEFGFKLVFCPHAVTFHYSRASQSFGRNRLKGTATYASRVFRNNLHFLRRHQAYLAQHHPRALLFGSPMASALLYGAYRTGWLIATEMVRWWRARKFGAPQWQ